MSGLTATASKEFFNVFCFWCRCYLFYSLLSAEKLLLSYNCLLFHDNYTKPLKYSVLKQNGVSFFKYSYLIWSVSVKNSTMIINTTIYNHIMQSRQYIIAKTDQYNLVQSTLSFRYFFHLFFNDLCQWCLRKKWCLSQSFRKIFKNVLHLFFTYHW